MRQGLFTRIVCPIFIVAFLIQTTGCYSMQQIPVKVDPATGRHDVEDMEKTLNELNGKKVKIVLRDGESIGGHLIGYDEKTLQIRYLDQDVGLRKNKTINLADVRSIYQRKFSEARTEALVVSSIISTVGSWIGMMASDVF